MTPKLGALLCGGGEIARHQRCYGSGTFVFDPLENASAAFLKGRR